MSGLHTARAVALIPHMRWERTNRNQHKAGGTKGMVKARVALATELLADVMRDPRLASLEALPWCHPFALSHFLEGVQEQCPRHNPLQALPSARRWRGRGEAFPLCWEGEDEGLSPLWGGSLRVKASSPSWEKVACERRLRTYPKGQDLKAHGKWILPGSPCHPPGNAHGGRTVEVLCRGLAEDIVTTPGRVMMD
jgi:hypothetical protein